MINIVMRKILKYFETKQIFTSKKISASSANDEYIDPVTGYTVIGDPEVLWDDICFIEDTKEAWTHGEYWISEPSFVEIEDGGSASSHALSPNTLYVFTTRTSDLTLTLTTGEAGKVNEYHLFIVTGATAPTITWPIGLSWNGGYPPTITTNKTYEISILNNIAIYIKV